MSFIVPPVVSTSTTTAWTTSSSVPFVISATFSVVSWVISLFCLNLLLYWFIFNNGRSSGLFFRCLYFYLVSLLLGNFLRYVLFCLLLLFFSLSSGRFKLLIVFLYTLKHFFVDYYSLLANDNFAAYYQNIINRLNMWVYS